MIETIWVRIPPNVKTPESEEALHDHSLYSPLRRLSTAGKETFLLLLTDGITEVAGQNEAELGAEPIKSGLRQWADLPLPEVFRNIRELALRFGKQLDDQTMLLVRRL